MAPETAKKRIVLIVLLTILSISAAFASSTSWPMFHLNLNHTGAVGTLSFSGNHFLQIANFTAVGASDDMSPIVANDVIYIGSGNKIYALNASNLKHIANFTTGSSIESPPAMANGIVYIGSDDGNLYALNASNLKHIANFTLGSSLLIRHSSPAVSNGIVYIGSTDAKVYALNASNLKHIANFTTSATVHSSPAISSGIVYVGSSDNKVYALNASNLKHIANFTTLSNVQSSPAVSNGIVYVGSSDNKVYALNASNLKHIANFTTLSNVQSSPAISDGVVYIGSRDSKVYALNASNLVKITNFTAGSSIAFSSPAVFNGVVYIGSDDGNLYALNETNLKKIAKFTTQTTVKSSPVVFNGTVYFGTNGVVYALRLNSSDIIKPEVKNVKPSNGSSFNVNSKITISANVTDDVNVGSVNVNITKPGGTISQVILKHSSSNKYNNTFTVPNVAGTYTVRFIANDTSNNVNNTVTTIFTAKTVTVSGGGGGGSVTLVTVPIPALDSDVPRLTELQENVGLENSITFSHHGALHHVKVVSIDYNDRQATLEIASTPKNYTFFENKPVLLDLDGSGQNDTKVTVTDIQFSYVTVLLDAIKEAVAPVQTATGSIVQQAPQPKAEPVQQVKTAETKQKPNVNTSAIITIVVIALIALGAGIWLFKRRAK